MQSSPINRDLVRWSRRHWFWAIVAVAGLQFGVLYYFGRPVYSRTVYPAETALALAVRAEERISGEWLELQNPMLFASPNWNSVSALAWMRKPAIELFPRQQFPPFEFLAHHAAKGFISDPPLDSKALVTAHRRPPAEMTLPVQPAAPASRGSTLEIAGFDGRAALFQPALPAQYHNDYVASTTIEAGIDPDGFVIATRLVLSSGSKAADADALALARKLRFEPLRASQADSGEIAWGKLNFGWHALSLSPTNTVRR